MIVGQPRRRESVQRVDPLSPLLNAFHMTLTISSPTKLKSENMTCHTFREITSKEALEEVFRLRYQVLKNSRVRQFLQENETEWDIDIYDLHASHYGMFNEEEGLSGYLRIIRDRNSYFNPDVALVCRENNIPLTPAQIFQETAPFPFLSYPGVPEKVKEFYAKCAPIWIIEGSRLILTNDSKSFKTALALIECAIVTSMDIFGNHLGTAIVDCYSSHEGAYSLFGFKRIPGTGEYNVFESGDERSAITLFLDISSDLKKSGIPEKLHGKIQKMSAEFNSTSQISRVL